GKETVVDAYCGIGTIALSVSEQAGRVIGVEMNRDAVRDAVANARSNRIKNVDFYQNDAGRFLTQMAEAGEKVDVVFMDPPRSGSTKEFLDALIRIRPKRVVYISCEPETLARDLKYLTANSAYRMAEATPVDMFPFTEGIEVITKLQYCGNEKNLKV
ncbi:MAG: RsmD family RNA methyltransferase, partial [Lachnospiraceae bacterium]|nr:RsmD family RNA methyltransferase [Lachnospiraceae bacterium]